MGDRWVYNNPYYKPKYKQYWVAHKEGGMHPTYISYNEPVEYKGHYIIERIKSTNPDACVCDVLTLDWIVLTQQVTVRACERYIDSI